MGPPRERPKHRAPAKPAKSQDNMFVATPGFTPNMSRPTSKSTNKGDTSANLTAVSALTASALDRDNKENLTMHDRVKRNRRAATKKFSGVSPVKPQTHILMTLSSMRATMITQRPALSPMRELPNGSMEPPPAKRPRLRKQTLVLNETNSPPRQIGNIAGLLHDETLEINISTPTRSSAAITCALSPHVPTIPGPQFTNPRHALPSLTVVLSSDEPSHASLTARTELPQHLTQAPAPRFVNSIRPTSPLPSAYRAEPRMEPNPLQIETSRPALYPSPTFKPGGASFNIHTADQTLRHVVDNLKPLYPAVRIQPTLSVGQVPTKKPLREVASQNSQDVAVAPSTNPQAAEQQSSLSPNTAVGQSRPQPTDGSTDLPLVSKVNHPGSSISPSQNSQAQHIDLRAFSAGVAIQPMPESYPMLPPPPVQPHVLGNVSHSLGPASNINKGALIHKDDEANVVRRLSERSYLNLLDEPEQNNMVSTPEQSFQTEKDDEMIVRQVLAMTDRQRKSPQKTFGKRQAGRIHQVLSIARRPDQSQALFLSADEAAQYLRPNAFFSGIIVTRDQQPRPLQTTTEYLNEFYDHTAAVDIQDPSVVASDTQPAVPRKVTIGEVKKRFLQYPKTKPKNGPWNCLELATHVEDGLRPAFLAGEDCRLLTKLKLPSSEDKAGRRGYDPGWKEVEKWALLAQAGALTEPHQDSHGYNTYITVNHGIIGFGWLANPTAEERAQWRAGPHAFTGGKWRYIILRPGQTVYFPSGTVHFVFRLAATGDTLAFGGHVLRCSQIVRWIKTLIEEQADPDVTNEDLTVSAPAYLDRVEKFVRQAMKDGRTEIWGGKENIAEFLALKKEFERNKG